MKNDKGHSGRNSFSAFASASEEMQNWPIAGEGGCNPEQNTERGSRQSVPSEITVLERRVLAHERILQALIGHMAKSDPAVLADLNMRFGKGHNVGEFEQDYVSTDQFGEHFMAFIQAETDRCNDR